MANFFSKAGDWLSDRFGLKAPKITQPTLDPAKAGLNTELIRQIQELMKGFSSYNPYGTQGGPVKPFTFRPTYNPRTLADLNLTQDQGKIRPIGLPGTAALDVYSQAGNLLTSGGYDPAGKALAYEQMTRGFDEEEKQDLKDLVEMFGRKGQLKTSSMLGKIAETKRRYGTAKGEALGKVVLADLDKAEAARLRDIEQQDVLDIRNWQALQEVLGMAGQAGGGSPFTPQSMLDYENSMAKRNAWDQKWATIIDAAGKFGGYFGGGGRSAGSRVGAGGRRAA